MTISQTQKTIPKRQQNTHKILTTKEDPRTKRHITGVKDQTKITSAVINNLTASLYLT